MENTTNCDAPPSAADNMRLSPPRIPQQGTDSIEAGDLFSAVQDICIGDMAALFDTIDGASLLGRHDYMYTAPLGQYDPPPPLLPPPLQLGGQTLDGTSPLGRYDPMYTETIGQYAPPLLPPLLPPLQLGGQRSGGDLMHSLAAGSRLAATGGSDPLDMSNSEPYVEYEEAVRSGMPVLSPLKVPDDADLTSKEPDDADPGWMSMAFVSEPNVEMPLHLRKVLGEPRPNPNNLVVMPPQLRKVLVTGTLKGSGAAAAPLASGEFGFVL